jgi:hypothetical protein
MRITLTDAPISAANHGGPFLNPADLGKGGSGPVGGYQFGETEDYLLSIEPAPVPSTGDWAALALVLGLTGAFWLLLKRRRRGTQQDFFLSLTPVTIIDYLRATNRAASSPAIRPLLIQNPKECPLTPIS